MAACKGTVLEVIQETPSMKLFNVKVNGNLFDYKPGQFVIVSIDGVNNENGIIIKRSYSISSSPLNKDYLEFCISIKPDGRFTPHLNRLKHGDQVNLDGPYGTFAMRHHENGKLLFIAAGAGIAPLMSMIRTLLNGHSRLDITLLYGFRHPEDFCYKKELTALSSKHKNFRLYCTISTKEHHKTWHSDTGRVTGIIKKYLDAKETEAVYICGKPEMVKDTIALLREYGIDDNKIFKEQW